MTRSIVITGVAATAADGRIGIAVRDADGVVGELTLAAASVEPARFAAAIDRWRACWVGSEALAFERRWAADGRGAFAHPDERAAWSAVEFACVVLVARVLGLRVDGFLGGSPDDPVASITLPDDAGLVLDAAAFATPQALATACRDSRALALRFTLATVAGPQGLRRVLAAARTFSLDACLDLTGASHEEIALGLAVARAFGCGVHGAPGHVDDPGAVRPVAAIIRRIRLRRIRLPLANVYVSAMYLMDHVQRTIVEFESDDGLVGLGETLGADDAWRLTASMARAWIGADAFARRTLARRHYRILYDNRNGRNGLQALGGLDMAGADLAARRLDLPLARWLGEAAETTSLPVVSLLPTALLDRVVPRAELRARLADVANVEGVARHARGLRDRSGIRAFKYKSSGLGLAWDVAAIRALRDAVGPDAHIRFDPNAAYGPTEALAICRALEPYTLAWYEDPTDGLDALARIRAHVTRPIASNMGCVQIDHLAPTVRSGAIDIVLGDTLHWGGVEGLRDLAAACEVLGLQLANHAFYESGVAAAANVHVACGLGLTTFPHDQTHDGIAADVIEGSTLAIVDGVVRLPAGSGLAVRLDPGRLETLQTDEIVIQ